jgi:hypothetical protein
LFQSEGIAPEDRDCGNKIVMISVISFLSSLRTTGRTRYGPAALAIFKLARSFSTPDLLTAISSFLGTYIILWGQVIIVFEGKFIFEAVERHLENKLIRIAC